MGHHSLCADWVYDTHPAADFLVGARCAVLAKLIAAKPANFARFGFSTLRAHAFLFKHMAPVTCLCLLGRYRGDRSCPQLAEHSVGVSHDRRVGVAPKIVAVDMRNFESQCRELVDEHGKFLRATASQRGDAVALAHFVELLAILFARFLTIHPYADGNGHMARLLIYVVAVRLGYAPVNWNIHWKKPCYEELSAHRDGNREPLQMFLMNALFFTDAPI